MLIIKCYKLKIQPFLAKKNEKRWEFWPRLQKKINIVSRFGLILTKI